MRICSAVICHALSLGVLQVTDAAGSVASAAATSDGIDARQASLTPVQLDNLRKMVHIAQAVAPDACPTLQIARLAQNMTTPMNQEALKRWKSYITDYMAQQRPDLVQQVQQQQRQHLQQRMLLQDQQQEQQQLQSQQEVGSQQGMQDAQQVATQYQGRQRNTFAQVQQQQSVAAQAQQQQQAAVNARPQSTPQASYAEQTSDQPASDKLSMLGHAQVNAQTKHIEIPRICMFLRQTAGETDSWCMYKSVGISTAWHIMWHAARQRGHAITSHLLWQPASMCYYLCHCVLGLASHDS